MKLQRLLVLVVLVVVCVALVWHFAPGCRQQAVDAYKKYGGWTEEARRADPVGFINYAEGKLQGHLADMQQTTRDLAAARERLQQATDRARKSVTAADQMAESFRTAYQQAETDAAYPVTMEGRPYTRAELIEQVRLILQQRADSQQSVGQLEQTAETTGQKATELLTQITRIKAALEMLPAQREIARASKLTGETEKTWSEVNDLIGRNETMLTESPVRTVDELLRDREAGQAKAGDVDVLAFLEGGK